MVKKDYLTRNRISLIGYIADIKITEVKVGEGFDLFGTLILSTSQGHWIDEDKFQEDNQLHTIELTAPWSVYCKRFQKGDLIGVEGRLKYRDSISKESYIEVIDMYALVRPGLTHFPTFNNKSNQESH